MKSILKEWFRGLEHRYEERPRQYQQPPTVIRGYFDELFLGGDVVFLYAHPQIGATALLLKLLLEFSESERPVLYASSRTDPMNFMTRLMAAATGVPLSRLAAGQLFSSDFCHLTKYAASLFDTNIFHAVHYEMDPLEISQKMRLWRYQHNNHRGLLLYDDYADLSISGPGDFERNIADLKSLAQETSTLLVVSVRLGNGPYMDYDLDRLFTVEEWPGEQFAKRVVMRKEGERIAARMISCPEQSGRALWLGYNRQTDSLEYFL
ncbi:MAG: DnaB-like helicase C-terminal domain-containing protein [Desulfuromonadales bacterium]|nr:DnaB-like helicase C-terminal domain-containing protein [Desulfuromonadales bacterium]